MNLKELFQMQWQLDQHIEEKHPRENGEDRLPKKTLSFLVEVSELANETRCFKYWSNKPPSARGIILEEYADGFHFLLSIGNETNMQPDLSIKRQGEQDLIDTFLEVKEYALDFDLSKSEWAYSKLFVTYLELGEALGFTLEEIVNAYKQKHEINYQRQAEGY